MSNDRTGKFNLIMGCMWSGKTSELISRYNRYILGGKKCIMIKYKLDTRYSNENKVVTHNGIVVNSISCCYLYEVEDIIVNYDVICVDEIQFFEDGDIFCDKWANEGKIVEACGLNGTSYRTPFNVISNIIPQVDDIYIRQAVCVKTGCSAIYSGRISDDIGDKVIGGDDKYVALDRKSYLEINGKSISQYKFEKFVKFLENIYEKVNIKCVPNFEQNIKYSDYIEFDL